MEKLILRQPSAFRLIRIMFYLLFSVIVVIFVLTFTLNINDSVKIVRGELVSKNTPIRYLAQFEAKIANIRVSEGEKVRPGDTLIILENKQLQASYNKTAKDVFLMQENIAIYEQLLENLQTKIDFQSKQKGNLRGDYNSNITNSKIAVSALEEQLKSVKRKVELGKMRLDKDYELFRNGVISEVEFNQKYQTYLDAQTQYADLEKQYKQQKNAKSGLKHSYSSQVNDNQLNVLAAEQEFFNTKKILVEQQITLEKLEGQLAFEKEELDKQFIVSDIEGRVRFLFNSQQKRNYVNKNEVLAVVAPEKEEEFYAKCLLSQESVKEVSVGQATHIKLDAYNYYRFGVLKGEVDYIARADTSNNFYVLAKIPPKNTKNFDLKSGYLLKGEIILGRIKLYKFIFRLLFEK